MEDWIAFNFCVSLPFVCRYVRHMLQHSKLKPYDCELCDKSFTTPGTLEQHIRTHTGNQSFLYTVTERANRSLLL